MQRRYIGLIIPTPSVQDGSFVEHAVSTVWITSITYYTAPANEASFIVIIAAISLACGWLKREYLGCRIGSGADILGALHSVSVRRHLPGYISFALCLAAHHHHCCAPIAPLTFTQSPPAPKNLNVPQAAPILGLARIGTGTEFDNRSKALPTGLQPLGRPVTFAEVSGTRARPSLGYVAEWFSE